MKLSTVLFLASLCASNVSARVVYEYVYKCPAPKRHIEVQGHRGATGARVESSAYGYALALELGVDVLEMDVVITKDGVPIIWHDPRISSSKCKDTVKSGTNFPYVGKFVKDLTLKELKTLDCGSQQDRSHPDQVVTPGAKIQTLEEIIDLVECYGNKDVRLNVELKLDPAKLDNYVPASKYINDVVPVIEKRGFIDRVNVQSFDWSLIFGVREKFPHVVTSALIDETTITETDRGVSGYPWLGGLNLDDLNGDYVLAAQMTGSSIYSPAHKEVFSAPSVADDGYLPFANKDMVERAHKLGMKVVPWTVNDAATMRYLINMGVDGLITDYPELALSVVRKSGFTTGTKASKPKPECLKNAGKL